MYIGSSEDMGRRLLDHVFNYSSNLHLQNAIGSEDFTGGVYCDQ